MLPAETFRDTLGRLALILDQLGIRFHLTGGITTIAYGEPRLTQDVDVVVDPRALAAQLGAFLTAVEAAGFLVDQETTRRAVMNAGMFQLLDLAESLKIDLYPRQMIPGELDRSVSMEVFAGLSLPVASLADAALSKLMWAAKGSHKSRRDFRQILRRASTADRDFVERQAAALGHANLLRDLLAESDEVGP